jgi:predicted nucleic acid-binding protein
MIYADAGIIMRLVESSSPDTVSAVGSGPLVCSSISLTECLTGPLKRQDQHSMELFDMFFRSADVVVVDVDDPIARRAAGLRVAASLKTPDAIHLATALQFGCSVLFTTDGRLARPIVTNLIATRFFAS